MTHSGVICLSVATLTYGVLQVIDKAALNHGVETSSYTVCRVFIAMLFLFLYVSFADARRISAVFHREHFKDLIVIGVLGSGWGLLLQTFGLLHTTATHVSILLALVAPLTSVFAFSLLAEQISTKFTLASALMLAGVWLLYAKEEHAPFGIGDVMVIVAVIGYAYSNVRARQKIKDMPTSVVTLGRLVFGSLSIALIMPFLGVSLASVLQAPLLVVAGGAVFGLRMLAYYKGIEIEGAASAATFLLFSPLVTVLSAHGFLAEPLTWPILCGMTLVLIGGAILVREKPAP
jgi:drug/metabolite transporter (DMT)-like permease